MITDGPQPLSPPPESLLAHSERLGRRLRQEIAADGAMSFERFMELALYAPGLGYYSAGLSKLGADGDFVTAPELSPLFSRCLARQCAQVLRDIPRGVILELGAGTGRMARDLLAALEESGDAPVDYLILERSADLRQRQRETLTAAGMEDRVTWLDRLPDRPLAGLVLANEVLDALPVKRFRLSGRRIEELRVGIADDELVWVTHEADAKLAAAVEALELPALPDGYVSEINTGLAGWLSSVTECLESGVALFADYGYPRHEYYHPQRDTGTLICHYRRHAHPDALLYPGLQDISAFVDFTALAESGAGCGLDVAGFATQGDFLMNCGLPELLTDLAALPDRDRLVLAAQVKRLTLPHEMGEVFKVMALSRAWQTPLLGFARGDRRHRL